MNGFHSDGRDISAHESASTIGKKIPNWTDGKSIAICARRSPGQGAKVSTEGRTAATADRYRMTAMERGRPIVARLAIVAGLALLAAACARSFEQAAPASAPLVLGVPGLPARIGVAGIERLSDGAALIAATARRSRGPSRLLLVRLLADGTPDLAYGSLGVLSPALGDVRATALAVNPSTAEAWVGLALRDGSRGEIIAVDGHGRLVNTFGRHGRIELAGAPQAIAWRPGQLLLAIGQSPCRGCTIALASAGTGRIGRARRLDPASLVPAGGRCEARAVSAARFTPAGKVLLGITADEPGCGAAIDASTPAALLRPGVVLSTGLPFGRTARTALFGALGGQTCAAGSGSRGTVFGTLDRRNRARPMLHGPAGALIGTVALGHGVCSVLIRTRSGGLVLQAGRGRSSRDAVPRQVDPLGMFRCHRHLLVLGTARHGGPVIVVVPVRRGPYATAASATMASGSGCR